MKMLMAAARAVLKPLAFMMMPKPKPRIKYPAMTGRVAAAADWNVFFILDMLLCQRKAGILIS